LDADGFTRLAVETASNPNSPYSYIFSPVFDRHGAAAVKVMLASGGNEIRLFRLGSAPKTLVQDHAATAASSSASLDNGVALADSGEIAFVGKLGAHRGVFRTDGVLTTRIAMEGEGNVAQIGWFTPVIGPSGLVVFRGEDTEHRNTIWVGDGDRLDTLVAAGAALPADTGTAVQLPNTDFDRNNRMVFGGGMAINTRGEIVFNAALAQSTESGTTRLGTGLYVAPPVR